MQPEEVRTRAKRGLIPRGENRAPLGLIDRAFLSSVGRNVEEPHDIRRDELGIVSRTEGQTAARGPTENEGPRGTLRQVIL